MNSVSVYSHCDDMFVRRKRSVQKSGEYEYLQIVESVREGDGVRQKVIGTLRRADKVLASGKIDALIQSLAKYSQRLKVLEANRRPDIEALSSREWGPALVFESLWKKQGEESNSGLGSVRQIR